MPPLRFVGLLLLLVSLFAAPLRAAKYADRLMPVLSVDHGANPAVLAYLQNLQGTAMFAGEDTPGSFLYLHAWYASRRPSRRFTARGFAIMVIVLGAALPLVSASDKLFKHQKFWIPLLGAAIVVGQGIEQTLQSTQSWQNYTLAMLSLEQVHQVWQNRVVDAALQPTGGVEAAQKATDDFTEQVAKIVLDETRDFFEAAKPPTVEPSGK